MKNLGLTVIKNAAANFVRGSATAVVSLALPVFLTRTLDTAHFSAWSLLLQISVYSSYFDFGIQTAVARFLAQAIELDQKERQQQLVDAALLLLSCAGLLAFLVIGAVVWLAPHVFQGIPPALATELRWAAIAFTLTSALHLPLSTYTGILIGLHRNEFPALAIGGSRLLGAAAVIIASHYTNSLLVLALCLSVPRLLGGLVQWVVAKRLLPRLQSRLVRVPRSMLLEFASYCTGLTVWAFGAFLITGMDLIILAHFSFASVGYYALASSLIMLLVGFNQNVFNAVLTPIAVLQARGEIDRIRSLVISTTRLNTCLNLALLALIADCGYFGLKLSVGPAYAALAFPILLVLAMGQTLRLVRTTYSVMLVGTGNQNHSIPQSVAEAVVNVGLSIPGAIFLGPIGVAWGTVAGAVAGFCWQQFHTMRHAKAVPFQPLAYFLEGTMRPLLCFAPLLFDAAYRLARPTAPHAVAALTLSLLTTGLLLKTMGKLGGSLSFRSEST